MHKFVRKLITEWRRLEMPFSDETVIVAVSGGADSTALLLALIDLKRRKKLQLEFIVAHFNHKLRGRESDLDEKFVRELARENDLEFVTGSDRIEGTSDVEQRARNARYDFLAKLAKTKKTGFVLTAHTVNDQAETFLLNLVRGSGVDGLCAMTAIRPLERTKKSNGAKLIRPLLHWAKRADTEEFCRDLTVKFRRDRMNDDLRFTRVRIRKTILPELETLNPKIVETLAKTATLLQQKSGGSSNASKGEIEALNGERSEQLFVEHLISLPENKRFTAIRAWLIENRGSSRGLTLKHIDAVARLVKSRKSGRLVELPNGDSVVKGGGRLAFRHIKLEY